jgi:hypothetical protein
VAVVVARTGPRCKLCRHPRRADIDAELELRSRLNGQPDEKGVVHNLEYVLALFESWGVENPTADNIKNHWGNESKHSYPVTDDDAAAIEAAAGELSEEQLAVVERVLGEDVIAGRATATPEQLLELQRALFPFELIQKIKEGKPLGITWDQLDRGLNTVTRRRSEDQAASLIGSLAGAIEQSARTAGKAIDAMTAGDEPIEGRVVEAEEVRELPAGG